MPAKRLVMLAAIIVVVALASPAFAQGPKNCQSLAGSLAAQLELHLEPIPMVGWFGDAFLAIGRDDPLTAGLAVEHLERPTPPAPTVKGLWGREKYVFDLGSGDTLEMEVDYSGIFSPVPYMAQYNATGKVTGGSGVYANASGNVTVHGPFVALPPTSPTIFGSWIAELKGTVCDVQ